MEKLKVIIDWCEENYGAALDDPRVEGCVVATGGTLEAVKEAFASALRFHIDGMVKDGDNVPDWQRKGAYQLDFHLTENCKQRS